MGYLDRKCIITLIDLIDVKKKLLNDKSNVISQFLKLEEIIQSEINLGLKEHDHAYSWTDSALLLSYLDSDENIRNVLKELNNLKRKIDLEINLKSYFISVKGITYNSPFPDNRITRDSSNRARHIHIKASSMAFSNCFEIEKTLGYEFKKEWYIDSRIIELTGETIMPIFKKSPVNLLPDGKKREIYMFDGYLNF